MYTHMQVYVDDRAPGVSLGQRLSGELVYSSLGARCPVFGKQRILASQRQFPANPTVEALIIRIGFGGISDYNCNKEPPKLMRPLH